MVQLSPIFSRTPARPPVPQASPALPGGSTRLAGTSPALSSLFKRAKPALPFVGPGLTAGFAGYRLQQGEAPQIVATDVALDEGASVLGAGIGAVLGGPFGAAAGGIAAPILANALLRDEEGKFLRPVDLSGFSAAEIQEMVGSPRVGGLTVPAPYEAPAPAPLPLDIDWSQAVTTARRETGGATPERGVVTRPADRRPVEESRPAVTRQVDPSTTPASDRPSPQVVQQVVQEDLLKQAAEKARTADLIQRMKEVGATGGMGEDAMRTWVSSHQDLAERLIEDRLGKEARLAKEFSGFSAYA